MDGFQQELEIIQILLFSFCTYNLYLQLMASADVANFQVYRTKLEFIPSWCYHLEHLKCIAIVSLEQSYELSRSGHHIFTYP